MEVSIQMDKDDGEVLAVYFTIGTNKVHKTVEVAEGECYVDLDRRGNPVGVEMLVPSQLHINANRVAKEYNLPVVKNAVKNMSRVLSAA